MGGKGDKSLRATLLAAVVGGLLALGGTVATIVVNDRQAEDAESKRATGAARLLADNLRRGESVMADSLTDCRYRLYDVPLSLPHDDLVLLAWRLDPAEWDTVARAMAAVRLQVARSREPRLEGHEFDKYDVAQVSYVVGAIDDARHALADASGLKPSSAETVEEALARGARCGAT